MSQMVDQKRRRSEVESPLTFDYQMIFDDVLTTSKNLTGFFFLNFKIKWSLLPYLNKWLSVTGKRQTFWAVLSGFWSNVFVNNIWEVLCWNTNHRRQNNRVALHWRGRWLRTTEKEKMRGKLAETIHWELSSVDVWHKTLQSHGAAALTGCFRRQRVKKRGSFSQLHMPQS